MGLVLDFYNCISNFLLFKKINIPRKVERIAVSLCSDLSWVPVFPEEEAVGGGSRPDKCILAEL